jgi:hypothetical protein
MKNIPARSGYVFLISVLVIGAIASATSVSLLLLGWAAEQSGLLLVHSAQAYEYAQTCAERTMHSLRRDLNYSGDETFAFDYGSCAVALIGGSGNEDRTVCVSGSSGDSTRRLQVQVARLYPSVMIESWQEVSAFTLCQ